MRLGNLRTDQGKLNKEIEALEKQLAEIKSPFVVGEKIEFRYGRGRIQGVVIGVFPRYGNYMLVAQRLKKDGSLGATVSVFTYDKPEKVAA
ncbi:hypothetical protein R69919_00768 [Paraburkholderia gardini]|nr:hypothetical protein R69919_00768 [Paraburkholderia gardini]